MKSWPDKIKNNPSLKGFLKNIENSSVINQTGRKLAELLLQELDQSHLFHDWDDPGIRDDEKVAFMAELVRINDSYPGGVKAYVENGRRLLRETREGKNSFDGYTPSQPDTVNLTDFGEEYFEYERQALSHLGEVAVVLVAGGLGERLGYSGIKLDIPFEVVTGTTYLGHYSRVILAMESKVHSGKKVPFIIMTSGDTHERTLESLERNGYFGLSPQQVIILRQELVPAIIDNDGHLAMSEKYRLVLKPHGHGDIHILMHTSGTAARLLAGGIRYLLFIQDTNGQVFNAAFAAIGASIRHGFDFNSVAVNRVPKEAVGAIAKLTRGTETKTLNIEYNLLDPLLRATVDPRGDVASGSGFSLFPGNINVLVIRNETYVKILERTSGIIAEFVNPKYADERRSAFKSPTRLETMMQDLPKLFDGNERVGVTVFDRKWCFSANKNNLKDAADKFEKGAPPESAATAESDFYHAGRMKCMFAGASVAAAKASLIYGVPFEDGPKVLLSPAFALTVEEVKSKVVNLTLETGSTIIVDGEDIKLDGVTVKSGSSLKISAASGAKVLLKNLKVENAGHRQAVLSSAQMAEVRTPEFLKIRGYTFEERGLLEILIDRPGYYFVDEDGSIRKLKTEGELNK
ncbi:MAG: UTP--glucose-1-phosphate uridylyltransferase [Oligoflexales bacterium]|nr:UTP--glucose-1-phosphate uridylyltransferase [Oligoflexales bacterium]